MEIVRSDMCGICRRCGSGGEEKMSYYDEPLLKPPVWKWYIPAYFVLGGIAGASSALAAVTPLKRLQKHGRRMALVSVAFGTVALVADLGRPERFVNMLRVFRPTSPMSVGSWLLAAYGPAAGAAAVLPAPLAAAAGVAAGVTGIPVAGYTGVLLAGKAV